MEKPGHRSSCPGGHDGGHTELEPKKLTIWDIHRDFTGFIENIIKSKLHGQSHYAQDEVYQQVIKDIEKIINERKLRAKYGTPSIKRLLRIIIIRRCADHFRKISKKPKKLSKREATHQRKFESMMTDEEIFEALKKAGIEPEDLKYSQILMLKWQGKSRKEIVEITGLKEQQIKGRSEYAKKKLRETPSVTELLNKVLSKEDKWWIDPKKPKRKKSKVF